MSDLDGYRSLNRARALKTDFYQILVKKKGSIETMMVNEYRSTEARENKILGFVAEISCIRSQMDELERNINSLEANIERL